MYVVCNARYTGLTYRERYTSLPGAKEYDFTFMLLKSLCHFIRCITSFIPPLPTLARTIT